MVTGHLTGHPAMDGSETRAFAHGIAIRKHSRRRFHEVPSTVLNRKVYAALSPLLSQFGQLLELHCNGDTVYFYNVTNLIDVIDVVRSELEGRSVVKEAFRRDAIPSTPQIHLYSSSMEGLRNCRCHSSARSTWLNCASSQMAFHCAAMIDL